MPHAPDPGGAAAAWPRAFRTAVLDPGAPAPAGLHGCAGSPAGRRFDVYRNNVVHSLTTALAEIFPAVERLVGAANFGVLARAFVRAHPPRSPLLFAYGEAFADFLARYEPVRALVYLPDVARIERAWLDAYHAADAEPLPGAALAALAPDRLAVSRFRAHPATRLVRSRYAAASIVLANRGTPPPAGGRIRAGEAEAALVTRPALTVTLAPLCPAEGAFFAALLAGRTLQAAAGTAAEEDAAFDLAGAIRRLVDSGAFAALRTDAEGEREETTP